MERSFFTSAFSQGSRLTAGELRDISRQVHRRYAPRYPVRHSGQSGKTRFSVQELRAVAEDIRRHFTPLAGAEPALVLLPIDPRRVYAYWRLPPALSAPIPLGDTLQQEAEPADVSVELTPSGPAIAASMSTAPQRQASVSPAPPVLRVLALTPESETGAPGKATEKLEIRLQVTGRSGCEIQLPEPWPRSIVAVLGVETGATFSEWLHSNVIELPKSPVWTAQTVSEYFFPRSIMPQVYCSSPGGMQHSFPDSEYCEN